MTTASVEFGPDPRGSYEALAEQVTRHAPHVPMLLAGFTACVDAVYRMDGTRMEALAAEATQSGPAAAMVSDVLARVTEHRGGEIFTPWPAGADWLMTLLGEPDALQIGGTSPQAAWSLAVLGAPIAIALADRSHEQLAVLHPDIKLCGPAGTVPVSAQPPQGEPTKPRHVICEFTSGIQWSGGTVARSTRIILRFALDGVERDEDFARRDAREIGGALVSGMNVVAEQDTESRDWIAETARNWRERGVRPVHHELAEFGSARELRAATALPGVTSLGMSLSELRMLAGSHRVDPVVTAHDLALATGVERLCVHADGWSLAVHRDDPGVQRIALATGNLLATARAAAGRPVARPRPHPEATYTAEHPASRALGDGWRADCVPAPYLAWPAGTVGLGDTFTAGTLLGLLLDTTSPEPPLRSGRARRSTVDQ